MQKVRNMMTMMMTTGITVLFGVEQAICPSGETFFEFKCQCWCQFVDYDAYFHAKDKGEPQARVFIE